MGIKRMRVFAGPNGSGKTTIIKKLQAEIPLGVYVNADDIEVLLKQTGVLLFNTYQLLVSNDMVQDFFRESTFAPLKRNEPDLYTKLQVINNVLHVKTTIDSYLSADIAEFIRQLLLQNGISFTYETVMSHESKINFMKMAQDNGFKVYIYFVCTSDPLINIGRVNIRVAQNGHAVEPLKIENRYYKSLNQLRAAVKNSDSAYLFDTSEYVGLLIAEIKNGVEVEVKDINKVPNWVNEYLFID